MRGAAGTQRGSSALKTTARAVSVQPITTELSPKPDSPVRAARAERKAEKAAASAQSAKRAASIPTAPQSTKRTASVQPAPSGFVRNTEVRPAQKAAGKQPQDSAGKQAAPVRIYPQPAPKEGQLSIADTVKKVTGKNYGIYRELFFKEVRTSIRAILQYSAIHKLSFFGSEQNNAEDIIYQFLETNYDNQADVLEEGFRIDSLEPIIRHWAQHNI